MFGLERVAGRASERTRAVRVSKPELDQAIRKLVRDLIQRQVVTRAGRTFDLEIVAVVMMKLLERFDQEIIDRHPDRAAPVGVAAEDVRLRFARFVTHHSFDAIIVEGRTD